MPGVTQDYIYKTFYIHTSEHPKTSTSKNHHQGHCHTTPTVTRTQNKICLIPRILNKLHSTLQNSLQITNSIPIITLQNITNKLITYKKKLTETH